MSLLGSMGGISFDQERDRLDRIRQQLTAQFRRATTAIESDLEQSSQWLRELLGTTMPALRQTFEAQARLAPEVTAAVEDALRDARALSPEQLAAAARSELAAQLDQARNEQIRRLSELGVDPTSLRTTALDRMTQVQGAGEIARTGILARLAGIDQRGAALARAFDLYRAGSATGLAGLGLLDALSQMRARTLGRPLEQGLGLANLIMQGAQLRMASSQSNASALGSLLGGLGSLAGMALGTYFLGPFGGAAGAAAAPAAAGGPGPGAGPPYRL